jgi:hypothetical protein
VAFDRIAVLPFQEVLQDDLLTGVVRCPLCGTVFSAETADGRPEMVVARLFLEQLEKEKPKFSVISGEHVTGVYRQVVSTAPLKTPFPTILSSTGREVGAEGIVTGYVYRFRERKGEPFAVEKPASVAFEIHLTRVEDGALVWKGTYDQTQRSLMEDLFQASSLKWIRAEELAAEGMRQILKTFPGLP